MSEHSTSFPAAAQPGPRLAHRVALVTGAGSDPASRHSLPGTGEAIARLLASAGAHVIVADRDRGAGELTVERIVAEGGSATFVACDVSSVEQCRAAVDAAAAWRGRLDILVNNAGVTSTAGAEALSEAEWDRVLGVNLKGAMFMSSAAIPVMAGRGGGSIVNIVSAAGRRSFSNPAYAASKSGLVGLTVDLAGTHGGQGIRVNAVMPGSVYTPMVERLDPTEAGRDFRARSNPLGTEGTAWDVAWAVLFLAGDEARWITAVTLPVDGGMLVMPPRRPSASENER